MLLAIGSCSTAEIVMDQKLAADLSYIKIVRQPPSPQCRYLGEALSFYMTGPWGIPGDLEALIVRHENELRMKAKKLGANVIDTRLDADTGFSYKIFVHTFHAC
jgi:hypothetical protein